ncbi:nuclease-related domain-containing protein [Streptomyces sp. MS1.AVA.3]|uniref:nuclease-related domain-containing protein n=1 Tax=Streptomyces decoyicus TaxID=249567 RepID=UPI0030C64E0A
MAILATAVTYCLSEVIGWQTGVVAGASIFGVGIRKNYRNGGSTYAKGAKGERRTARHLAPLSWCGFGWWAVIHDRAVKGANLDHAVVSRRGPKYIDTKSWLSESSTLEIRNGELRSGGYSQTQALKTVLYEASCLAQVLGEPAKAIVAVQGARVPGGRRDIHVAGGTVTVIQASELRRYLRSLPVIPGWTRKQVRAAARLIKQQLPPA